MTERERERGAGRDHLTSKDCLCELPHACSFYSRPRAQITMMSLSLSPLHAQHRVSRGGRQCAVSPALPRSPLLTPKGRHPVGSGQSVSLSLLPPIGDVSIPHQAGTTTAEYSIPAARSLFSKAFAQTRTDSSYSNKKNRLSYTV